MKDTALIFLKDHKIPILYALGCCIFLFITLSIITLGYSYTAFSGYMVLCVMVCILLYPFLKAYNGFFIIKNKISKQAHLCLGYLCIPIFIMHSFNSYIFEPLNFFLFFFTVLIFASGISYQVMVKRIPQKMKDIPQKVPYGEVRAARILIHMDVEKTLSTAIEEYQSSGLATIYEEHLYSYFVSSYPFNITKYVGTKSKLLELRKATDVEIIGAIDEVMAHLEKKHLLDKLMGYYLTNRIVHTIHFFFVPMLVSLILFHILRYGILYEGAFVQ